MCSDATEWDIIYVNELPLCKGMGGNESPDFNIQEDENKRLKHFFAKELGWNIVCVFSVCAF